jgi:dihydroorotate dehydrogenase
MQHHRYVPLVVKIAPDLSSKELDALSSTVLNHHIDGLIASNTTLDRTSVHGLPHAQESGGLSGAPLHQRTTALVHTLSQRLRGRIPIIACGGICSAQDAQEKLAAGAQAVQIYTGLIYRGPGLVQDIVRGLA